MKTCLEPNTPGCTIKNKTIALNQRHALKPYTYLVELVFGFCAEKPCTTSTNMKVKSNNWLIIEKFL